MAGANSSVIPVSKYPHKMESGQGITNYAIQQPSYAFSAATTEFDDALVQRGIVTTEQVLLAKGMSVDDAQRLLEPPRGTSTSEPTKNELPETKGTREDDKNDDDDNDDEYELDDDEEDEFMIEYRQKRMLELKDNLSHPPDHPPHGGRSFGEVIYIDRTEWIRHVNEDSVDAWVVVCLTSSDTERTGRVEAIVQELAMAYDSTKFVLIPSHSAIPNWPEENLPSLFLYRDGRMQHELVRLATDLTSSELEEALKKLTVIE